MTLCENSGSSDCVICAVILLREGVWLAQKQLIQLLIHTLFCSLVDHTSTCVNAHNVLEPFLLEIVAYKSSAAAHVQDLGFGCSS